MTRIEFILFDLTFESIEHLLNYLSMALETYTKKLSSD
jgi:hypothetical protein